MCQELGRPNWVDISGLGPLLHWLEDAAADGLLTPPHRFIVPTEMGLIPIDVTGEEVPPDVVTNAELPRWDGDGFRVGEG